MSVFGVFLVRIFLHSDCIRRDILSLGIQSECGKIRARKLRIRTLFTQCEVFKELFVPKTSPYDFRNRNLLQRRRANFIWHDTELVSYIGPKIWDLAPNEVNQSGNLNAFKFRIKKSVSEGCPT